MNENDWDDIENAGHRVVAVLIAFTGGFLFAFLTGVGC